MYGSSFEEYSWRLLDVDLSTGDITPHAMSADPQNSEARSLGGDRSLGHFPFYWNHQVFAYGADRQELYIVGGSTSWKGAQFSEVETPGGKIGNVIAFNTRTNTYRSLTDPDDEANMSHVTATNHANPGYVFVTYTSTVDGGSKYNGEIIAVNLEDPGNAVSGIIRLAHHRTNASNDLFNCQSHITVSPDGTRLLYSSTWGPSQSVVGTYVIDLNLPPL